MTMTLDRTELAALDFSDVATGEGLPAVHPGDVLLHDFIEPLGITRYRVAKGTGVPQRRIDEICSGKRGVTADTALRLGRFFGMEAAFWLNLQGHTTWNPRPRPWASASPGRCRPWPPD
jgi:addiction module HigA family antidote